MYIKLLCSACHTELDSSSSFLFQILLSFCTLMYFSPLSTRTTTINYGRHVITPQYPSPMPVLDGILNICSKCFSTFADCSSMHKHNDACKIPFPIIYRDGRVCISRVDGQRVKQLMFLFSMKFIKSKTLFYEAHHFEVFVAHDEEILGYFSRRKEGNNSLNCLFVLPPFQGQGIGSLLIDYSYAPRVNEEEWRRIQEGEAPARESKEDPAWNGPEKPLSKKAIFCYRRYWKYRVVGGGTVREISKRTNMSIDDVIVGLELQGFDFKKWSLSSPIELKKPRMLSKKVYRIVENTSQ